MSKLWRVIVAAVLALAMSGCAINEGTSKARDYRTIDRGSYRGSFYTVEKGDTLYYIAYITDKDVNSLIHFNKLKPPYTLRVGQKIKLWHPEYSDLPPVTDLYNKPSVAKNASQKSTPKVTTPPPMVTKPSKVTQKSTINKLEPSQTKEYVGSKLSINKDATSPSESKPVSSWLWPTKGRVVGKFSVSEQGSKGIDIAGQRGQSVVSTASGNVVYSGSALRGYGNLVIVKHNDNYLSAYAHNDRLLVREGDMVKAGQKIATMGSSGTNKVMLHFEIRYQGKSVNPERYLP